LPEPRNPDRTVMGIIRLEVRSKAASRAVVSAASMVEEDRKVRCLLVVRVVVDLWRKGEVTEGEDAE